MTLTNRVSLFFLTALAFVLVAYSVSLFILVRSYLLHQLDQQLLAAFNTLVAAVEVESDDAKWEPADHNISTRTGSQENVFWAVRDEQGRVIDQAAFQATADSNDRLWLPALNDDSAEWLAPHLIVPYRVVQRTLKAPDAKPSDERDPAEYAALTVTAAVSTTEMRSMLWWLAGLLTLLSVATWVVAAIVGRRYCRRALRPVEQMAHDARAITEVDLKKRLNPPGSGDELEDLGSAFNGLLDRIHHALEREQRFAGDAAHQLRTPVTVLLGQLEVAQRRPRTVEDYQQLLGVLHNQTEELRQLIESLLFLVRADHPSQIKNWEQIDLSEWLPAYLSHWSHHARAADLQVRCLADEGCRARTVPPLLGQLVDNLIENAFKYSPPGSAVEIVLNQKHGQAEISIEDHGSGIHFDDLPHIFDPFYRSASTRHAGVPGTGLGLSVARRIADVLGVSLDVDSTLAQGSRFTIRGMKPRSGDTG